MANDLPTITLSCALALALALALTALPQAAAVKQATVYLKIDKWKEDDHKARDGDCCECSCLGGGCWCHFGCPEKCDIHFAACLGKTYSDIAANEGGSRQGWDPPSCTLAAEQFSTIVWGNAPDSFNPNYEFIFSIEQALPFSFGVRIDAFDKDGDSAGDLVQPFSRGISPSPTDGWVTYNEDMFNADFTWSIRVACEPNFFGTRCQTYCRPGENSGHYSCDSSGKRICDAGWTGSYCNQDINACQSFPCDPNASCADLPPPGLNAATGRTCTCNAGYSGDGETCTDIDACVTSACSSQSVCTDKPAPAGSGPDGRTCTCKPGLEGSDGSCTDIDACAAVPCPANAQCVDKDPPAGADANGRVCTCLTGFAFNGDKSACLPVCGDSRVVGGEACDDGNQNNNDGCSSTCQFESGWTCSDIVDPLCIKPASSDLTFGTGRIFTTPAPQVGGAAGTVIFRATQGLPDGLTLDTATGVFTANFSFPLEDVVSWEAVDNGISPARRRRAASAGETVLPLPNLDIFVLGTSSLLAPTVALTQNHPMVPIAPVIVGSKGAATFALVAPPSLPPGLELHPTAGLQGTPTLPTTQSVVMEWKVVSTSGQEAPLTSLNITVYPRFSAAGTRVRAVVNLPIDLPEFNILGGAPPLTFTHSGALPPGIELDPTLGTLTGIPTQEGLWQNIAISVSDTNGATYNYDGMSIEITPSLNVRWNRTLPASVVVGLDDDYVLPPPADSLVLFSTGYVLFRTNVGLEAPNCGAGLPQTTGIQVNQTNGAVYGRPTMLGVWRFCIVAEDEIGSVRILEEVNIEVKPLDCSSPSNGPNGQGCNLGRCIDGVRFDKAFTCNCSGLAFTGENCEIPIVTSTSSSTSSSSAIGAGVGVAVALIIIILLVLGYLWKRKQIKINHGLGMPESTFLFPHPDEWEYDRTLLETEDRLGEGQFGIVSKGTALNIRNLQGPVPVAIKSCLGTDMTSLEKRKFVEEAAVMKRFDHPNIIKLLGVCFQSEPLLIILEFMSNGDLRTYLRAHREEPVQRLMQMARDIASALEHLATHKIVHRDLAARNCLVDADLTIKLADFGLGKDAAYKDYYRQTGTALLPVRWMALESLARGEFTLRSDIWSYGVTVWEIMTHAEMPYAAFGNKEVFDFIKSGHRLSRPPLCSPELFDLLLKCWNANKERRPTPDRIVQELDRMQRDMAQDNGAAYEQKIRDGYLDTSPYDEDTLDAAGHAPYAAPAAVAASAAAAVAGGYELATGTLTQGTSDYVYSEANGESYAIPTAGGNPTVTYAVPGVADSDGQVQTFYPTLDGTLTSKDAYSVPLKKNLPTPVTASALSYGPSSMRRASVVGGGADAATGGARNAELAETATAHDYGDGEDAGGAPPGTMHAYEETEGNGSAHIYEDTEPAESDDRYTIGEAELQAAREAMVVNPMYRPETFEGGTNIAHTGL